MSRFPSSSAENWLKAILANQYSIADTLIILMRPPDNPASSSSSTSFSLTNTTSPSSSLTTVTTSTSSFTTSTFSSASSTSTVLPPTRSLTTLTGSTATINQLLEPPPHINVPLLQSLISISLSALETPDLQRYEVLADARRRYYRAHESFNAAYQALADEVAALRIQEAEVEILEKEIEMGGLEEQRFQMRERQQEKEVEQQQQQEDSMKIAVSSSSDNHILAHERELRQVISSTLSPSFLPYSLPVDTSYARVRLKERFDHARFLVRECQRYLHYRMEILLNARQKREEVCLWFSGVKMDFLQNDMKRLVFLGKHVCRKALEKERESVAEK